MAKPARSLTAPQFVTKTGEEVKLQRSTNSSQPYERFSKLVPGSFSQVGSQETTFLMCPQSTMDDARKAGIDVGDIKAFMKWVRARRGPVTNIFHVEAGPNQSAIWVQDKDTGINPEDYICTPLEGLKKK